MYEFCPKIVNLQSIGFNGDDFCSDSLSKGKYTERYGVYRRVAMEEGSHCIKPGEGAFTGRVDRCSFILGKIGVNILPCHAYPFPNQKMLDEYEENARKVYAEVGCQGGKIFEHILIISRVPDVHLDRFEKLSSYVQTIKIELTSHERYSVVFFNDPETPGLLHNFNIKFDDL